MVLIRRTAGIKATAGSKRYTERSIASPEVSHGQRLVHDQPTWPFNDQPKDRSQTRLLVCRLNRPTVEAFGTLLAMVRKRMAAQPKTGRDHLQGDSQLRNRNRLG